MRLGSWRFFEHHTIGDPPVPLLVRYILFRCPAFGIYLHRFFRSDDFRGLHDHPWPFLSIILTGGYHEMHDHTIDGSTTTVWHPPGRVLLRPAEWRHRVVLNHTNPVWTLVVVGRRARRWGFFLPDGWCWWRTYDHRSGICEDEVLWTEGSD